MPQALSLLTPDDLAPLATKLDALLELLSAAAQPADDYLSLDQVATATATSVRTVKKWIQDGKAGRNGRLIRLYALEFSPGYLRVPRSALLAYGQGLGFDAGQLVLPPAAAPHLAGKPPRQRPAPVLEPDQAMRRAS